MRQLRALSRPFAAGLPMLLLGTSIVLIAVLAWQAYGAAASHRALAERVLRDYADLAATEVGRRATSFIGNYGFGAALRGLSRALTESGGALPSREALAAAMPPQSRRAVELAGTLFRFDVEGERFEISGGELQPQIRRVLIDLARQPLDRPVEYRVLHLASAGGLRSFVLTANGRMRAGFEVSLPALTQWLTEFVALEPLLPPSLASRDAAQTSVRLLVRAPNGHVLFRSPGPPWTPSTTTIRKSLEDAAENSLQGFVAEVTIDPAAAGGLVIGGLPSSRLGLLLLLLFLSLGLTITAIVQIGREQALARLREDFVTRTSHELRTPVAQIRMFTETLLLDRVRTEDERRRSLEAIDRGARRLAHLVENVMQFARRPSRPNGLVREPADLGDLARQAIDEIETMAGVRGRIRLQAPHGVTARVDREGFRQILLNLLDNAAKYAGADAPILLTLAATDGEARLTVEDRGPGIPEPDREHVWQPYFRLERDRRSAVAGTGIGLAVVRDLVTQHEGVCRVEETPGGGARIVVIFPSPDAEPAA